MYEVRAKKLETADGNLLGIASFVVDGQFAFNGIRVIKSENTERGFFLSMPSFKIGEKYIDYFHPISTEMANSLANAIGRALDSDVTVRIGDTPTKVGINIDVNDEGKNKARVIMRLGEDFVCDSIHVVEGSKGLFVSMPSYKTKEGDYKDFCHPITAEYKSSLDKDIMDMYRAVKTVRDNMDSRPQGKPIAPEIDYSNTPFKEGEDPGKEVGNKSHDKSTKTEEEDAPKKGKKR